MCCWRKDLGWISKGTRYCQMIRNVNTEKRLKCAEENKEMAFYDVTYTDETMVQIETSRHVELQMAANLAASHSQSIHSS